VLPPDLADFTGRVAPLGEFTQSLCHGGLAVLSGPVGVGKATLAVHAAHQLAQRFPDGQLFVRLRTEQGIARAAGAVLLALLRLVGPPPPDGCDTEESDQSRRAIPASSRVSTSSRASCSSSRASAGRP